MTRFVREDGIKALEDRPAAEARYAGYLEELRYRGGHLAGYASRLHYFSEWLSDNAARGRLRLLTRELGGVPDSEPVSFMSAHPGSYRQMAEPGVPEAIRAMEQRLNAVLPRWYIPENRIAAVADRIHDGDIIAATSTLPGLDIAHTGIALWKNGELHLLHAPLVGKSVEISTLPLAQRILEIKTQDGSKVAAGFYVQKLERAKVVLDSARRAGLCRDLRIWRERRRRSYHSTQCLGSGSRHAPGHPGGARCLPRRPHSPAAPCQRFQPS